MGTHELELELEREASTMANGRRPEGYDCSPVIPSDKYVCPVCLLLLREPHLVSCCGHHFCGACVERVQRGGKACPYCAVSFTTMYNKGLEREMLNELQVFCTYKDQGCEWSDVLGKLEQHTNSACLYARTECAWNCGENIERRFLKEHEERLCPNRPWYTCFEDCNLRKFAERFEAVASENRTLREEVAALTNKVDSTCNENQVLRGEIEDLRSQLRTESQERAEISLRLENLSQELERLKLSSNRTCSSSEDNSEQVEAAAISSLEEPFIASEEEIPVVPFCFKMDKFKQTKQHCAEWYSPPFYTHEHGYKMCVRVDANGIMNGRGTHMSVYVYLMRGEYDAQLQWPFKGVVVVRLLNQLRDGGHHEKAVDFLDSIEDHTSSRVTVGDKSMRGQGFSQFIAHISLKHDAERSQQYLKDNCLKFMIAGVELKTPPPISKSGFRKWLSK